MGEPELDCQQRRWKIDGLRVSTQNTGYCRTSSGALTGGKHAVHMKCLIITIIVMIIKIITMMTIRAIMTIIKMRATTTIQAFPLQL